MHEGHAAPNILCHFRDQSSAGRPVLYPSHSPSLKSGSCCLCECVFLQEEQRQGSLREKGNIYPVLDAALEKGGNLT